MRGSMRQIRPGYWHLRVSLGRDSVTGKPRYRSRGLRGTKREAERALASLVTEVSAGRQGPTAGRVGALLDQWLEHIEAQGRSPSTLASYASLRDQLPDRFLRLPLRRVTPRTLDELYRHLGAKDGRGPSTVHHFHRLLRAAFNQAMRWELLDRNPAVLASPPRAVSPDIEPPTPTDVKQVLKEAMTSATPLNALVFRFMAATGCRRGEVCALRWNDIDLRRRSVTIRRALVQVAGSLIEKDTKAHQQRTITLDADTTEALRGHQDQSAELARFAEVALPASSFVFSDEPDGSVPIPPDRLSKSWTRLARSAGVQARLHDLRHLHASILLDAGEPITTVAARLGHRDTATTLRVYAHLMPGADQRAADLIGDMLRG